MHQTNTTFEHRSRMAGWRIYGLAVNGNTAKGPSAQPAAEDWTAACRTASGLGFDTISVPLERFARKDPQGLERCAQACTQAGLRLMTDLYLPAPAAGTQSVEALLKACLPAHANVAAIMLRGLGGLSPGLQAEFLHALAEEHGELMVTVWTPGMSHAQLSAMESLPVDGVYSSLPWWNFQDGWLIDEYERLRAIAPVIAPLADPRDPPPGGSVVAGALRRLAVASVVGEGVLVPAGHLRLAGREPLLQGLERAGPEGKARNAPRRLNGPLSEITVLFRGDADGRLLLLNPDDGRAGAITRALIERRIPEGYALQRMQPARFELEPSTWSFVPVARAETISEHGTTSSQSRRHLSNALRSSRIAIESVSPAVDGGEFGAKRILGELVSVRAVIFMDGHDELAAEVLWRAANESEWHRTDMTPLGNDLWEAQIEPRRLGRYVYAVRAWLDKWHTYCVQLQKKAAAGVDVSLEVEEGRRMLCMYLDKDEADGPAPVIEAALDTIGLPSDGNLAPKRRRTRSATAARPTLSEKRDPTKLPPVSPEQVEALLAPELAHAIRLLDDHAFEIQTPVQYPLSIERNAAAFSSWYELFPRSQSPEPGRHGTLRDVIAKLPMVRRMGFDVLYFPPIHPIGRKNRKGRNNSLQAGPEDPGSPYAIGSPDGGHDAVHPQLGTLDDFRDLVAAAQRHGMELALDFAIQCSPDHPWLRDNPDWFNWRVDGTLKYAENPPKRYEDIVNPDFYSPLASTPRQAALWRALRDIVLFWVHQGVRIFRVDNPHTKPLPFWQWLLREVHERYPDTIFLSEAFTRPAMMYRLAKIGFSQSYTYFTWRNTRQELTDYLTELNSAPVRDFFRPNFFVNTPDINPWFLQSSGRAGFLIRAVLAGTLSGSWGMYNGFELCVAEAVPGKEEYLDSEKYELRHWDMDSPGNIIEEVTRLNRIRRGHAALQSHLGVSFHESGNERILFYSRFSAEGDSVILVAVSMDPHHRQSGRLTLPLAEWGLAHDAQVPMHDLFEDRRFRIQGPFHHIELTPERPFVVWARVREQRGGMA